MNQSDASTYLLSWLRQPRGGQGSNYGYGVYLPRIIDAYLTETNPGHGRSFYGGKESDAVSPYFLAAAWDLCRRGILRPGVKTLGLQSTDEGAAGAGYSITPFGQKWLTESDRDDYVPTEPERFAEMIEPCRTILGDLFYQRAQEAIRCYGAHCYVACCAMSGAAAESILLAASGSAIAPVGAPCRKPARGNQGVPQSELSAAIRGLVHAPNSTRPQQAAILWAWLLRTKPLRSSAKYAT
jgi:hypothetical protein